VDVGHQNLPSETVGVIQNLPLRSEALNEPSDAAETEWVPNVRRTNCRTNCKL